MWPGNRCVECFEYPNLPRFGQTWECFYIDDVPGWCLGDIQRKLKDLCVGLAEVDEAGGNKRIHKFIQLELSNPILIQFAPFVTDHADLESVLCFEFADKLDHARAPLRLSEPEVLEPKPSE